MRTIKFRGQRVDNKEWVYGYLYITHTGEYEISNYNKELDLERYTYQVIPETVGQFTRLTDKNGKEIYEGDIIYNGVFKAMVEFVSGYFYPFTQNDICSFYPDECEVIGNVHDKELMEAQNENISR